jgi:Tol biopolymer transport system component
MMISKYIFRGIGLLVLLCVCILVACSGSRKITIISSPDKVNLTMNGESEGNTPLYEKKIIYNKHQDKIRVTARMVGFEPYEFYLEKSDKQRLYEIKLDRISKLINIRSTPSGAHVFKDGEQIGATPMEDYTCIFKNGNRCQFSVRKARYKEATFSVILKTNDRRDYDLSHSEDYNLTLDRIYKSIQVTSEPSGARLFIGDKEIGTTPLEGYEILFDKQRSFRITAKLPGFVDTEKEVFLEPLEKVDYSIILPRDKFVQIGIITFEPIMTENGLKLVEKYQKTWAELDSTGGPSTEIITNNNEPESERFMGAPVLSPVTDTLVFRVRDKNYETGNIFSNIWRMEIGGTGKSVVTQGRWIDLFPAFTPDGENLVFSSNRFRGHQTLCKINFNSPGGITIVTDSPSEDYHPSISPPDGLTYAYSRNPPNFTKAYLPKIWTLRANTTIQTALKEGKFPQISPDGETIIFMRMDENSQKYQIWSMGINGSPETQLTDNTKWDSTYPRWSPNGEWITYCCDKAVNALNEQKYDIWIMPPDGSQTIQVTANDSWDLYPCWDRNSEYIYFLSNSGGCWNIWRIRPSLAN